MVSLVQGLQDEYETILYAPVGVHQFLREKLPRVARGEIILRDIPHLHLAKKGTRIDYSRTLRENLPTLLSMRTKLAILRRQLREDGISALINDFEPFTALAASALGVAILQINHPGIVTRSTSLMPDALATRFIAHLMMPVYDRRLFISFYDGDLGPMIRNEITGAQQTTGDYFVVYLKPSYRRVVVGALESLGIKNYLLFPNSEMDYAQCLAGCRAVISSAGHQTLSEALFLGKPVFALPQQGQYEQRLNAAKLSASGWGVSGNFRRMSHQLAGFVRDVEAGLFPKPATLPWLRVFRDNHTQRVIRRVRAFIQAAQGPRIIPFQSYLLDGIISAESPQEGLELRARWDRWERQSFLASGGHEPVMRIHGGSIYYSCGG
jgi:uncharacterized protein (TIGR00661 family)